MAGIGNERAFGSTRRWIGRFVNRSRIEPRPTNDASSGVFVIDSAGCFDPKFRRTSSEDDGSFPGRSYARTLSALAVSMSIRFAWSAGSVCLSEISRRYSGRSPYRSFQSIGVRFEYGS